MRNAEESYKTFIDGVQKIQSVFHDVDAIREYCKETYTHINAMDTAQARVVIDLITRRERKRKEFYNDNDRQNSINGKC